MTEITAKTPWAGHTGDVPLHLDYFDGSMFEALELVAKKYPRNIAFDFMGKPTTYPQMIEEIKKCARSLKTIGVRAGDKVTIAMPNCPQALHAFYGLNRIGLLLKRRNLALEPLIHGGESTTIYRSGTPTVALASSLACALELAIENLPERSASVQKRNAELRAALCQHPKVRINSPENAIPHILNLSVRDVKGTVFQRELDARGVCVSVKSACSSDGLPSRAVFAVSRDRRNALSSWRISLSHLTTEAEIQEFLRVFDVCCQQLTAAHGDR